MFEALWCRSFEIELVERAPGHPLKDGLTPAEPFHVGKKLEIDVFPNWISCRRDCGTRDLDCALLKEATHA